MKGLFATPLKKILSPAYVHLSFRQHWACYLKTRQWRATSTVTSHLFFLSFSIFTPCGPQKNGIRCLDFSSPLFWLKESNKTWSIQMSLYFGPRLDIWLHRLASLFLSQLTDSFWLLISLSPGVRPTPKLLREVMDLSTSCPSSQMTTGESGIDSSLELISPMAFLTFKTMNPWHNFYPILIHWALISFQMNVSHL